MRPFGETMPLEQAQAIIAAAVHPIERTERVPLDAASGRVLARDVVATADVPPFSRAAMDGYAVRAEDTTGATRARPTTLTRIEQVFTGQMPAKPVGAGQCTEIATGAPMPAGADAVVMVEETEADASGRVRILSPVQPRQNVGRQGADIQAGQTVLHAGDVLNASRVGALAALGIADADVYSRPGVAILSTGNEIVEPGRPLAPGQIYDINRFTLSAIVSTHGGVPHVLAIAGDTVSDIRDGLERAAAADVIVFSGGSSAGEKDLIVDVLRASGEVIYHGIAVKPGKPTLFGRVQGKPVLGMPGNPTSCLSNAYLLLTPLLRRIARLPEYEPHTMTVPLARRVVSTPGRHQFYTVAIVDGLAVPAFKASGDITSMSQADGYFEIDSETKIVEAGEMVRVMLF